MTLINQIRFAPAVAALALLLTAAEPNSVAFAQTPAISAALPESTIKSLQEALNKQGIATKTDGVLTDETRAAIRKFQSQHHLPVTGEPDKPTLEKLGVAARQSAAPGGQTEQVQTGTRPNMAPGGMMQGGMMRRDDAGWNDELPDDEARSSGRSVRRDAREYANAAGADCARRRDRTRDDAKHDANDAGNDADDVCATPAARIEPVNSNAA